MKMNVTDFELELYLPEPTRYYFDSSLKEFHDLSDLEKVQHLAFCCANGWDMYEHVEGMYIDYEDVESFKVRLKETLFNYITFLRVYGDWDSEYVNKTYNQMSSFAEKFHLSIKDIIGVLCSDLNSYVHWKLDRGEIIFEDKLEIKI